MQSHLSSECNIQKSNISVYLSYSSLAISSSSASFRAAPCTSWLSQPPFFNLFFQNYLYASLSISLWTCSSVSCTGLSCAEWGIASYVLVSRQTILRQRIKKKETGIARKRRTYLMQVLKWQLYRCAMKNSQRSTSTTRTMRVGRCSNRDRLIMWLIPIYYRLAVQQMNQSI